MKKIIFVSHCILNTASKVVLYNQADMDAEENLRKKFMHKAIDQEVQIIQLPCPEFTLYGPKRWGHVSNQWHTKPAFSCALPYPPHRAERQMGTKATPGV